MTDTVRLEGADEGFAVSVPGPPGCHSQGATEAEALTDVADAIRDYLDVVQGLAGSGVGRSAEVVVASA